MALKPNHSVTSLISPYADIFPAGRKMQFDSFLLVVTIAVLLTFPVISTAAPSDTEKQKLETGINKYLIHINRLQQGIKLQQEEVEQKLSQEKDLLAELENMDNRLQEHHGKLSVLQGKMTAQKDLIAVKEKELAKIKSEKHTVQLQLQKRLSAYYKLGRIGLVNIAFSSHSLPELLSFHDSFQALIRHDQYLIDTYRHSIGKMERVKEAMTMEKALLQNFITQEEEGKDQIDRTKQDKERLLTLIRTQKKLHEQAIKEMEDAGNKLSTHLNMLEKKEQILDQGFLLNRGKLPPPVNGTVIALFNQEKTNSLGITVKYKGIAVKAPDGTKVKAIFDGTILFSGYLRGYGNTVIVDHGYQYYSILSRMDKLVKNKDDQVRTGDILALMGDTATLIDEGLYLEIRHESESLDPLQWLDKNKLTVETNEKKSPAKAAEKITP
jgi:murein hydrolase activator